MASEEELEARLARIELKVELARSDASAARILASGAHEDVDKYRKKLTADASVIHALRATQLEQGQRLAALEVKVDKGFAKMERQFAKVDEGFAKVERQFALQAGGQREITQLLNRLIDKNKDT